jgi:hypothetical protein
MLQRFRQQRDLAEVPFGQPEPGSGHIWVATKIVRMEILEKQQNIFDLFILALAFLSKLCGIPLSYLGIPSRSINSTTSGR